MARINLSPGIPEIIAIARPGESVPSSYTKGGFDVLFKTASGDSLYVDPERAGDIEREMQSLGIQYGERMQITRTKTSHGGHAYRVERIRDAGGHNVPERSLSGAGGSQAPTPRGTTADNNCHNYPQMNDNAVNPVTPASMKFCAAMMSMVDAMRETKAYALRCGLDMSTEDLRCLAVTAYINDAKGGAR